MTDIEEWREIPGYNGRYEASSHGRIRSWVQQVAGKSVRRSAPRILKPWRNPHRNYLVVPVSKAAGIPTRAALPRAALLPHDTKDETT